MMIVIAAGFLGLMVGSFINVLVLRFGFVEGRRPRSACMACGEDLAWHELVPVLSYLLLRARCAHCGTRLSWQYPAVEIGTSLLFVATVSTHLAPAISFALLTAVTCVFWAAFMALLVYDIRHTLVPLPFALTLIAAATTAALVAAWIAGDPTIILGSIEGGALLAGVIAFLVIVTRGKGMGTGDIYVAGAIGILLGLGRGFDTLVMAFWIGAVVGIVLMALKTGVRMKSEVPFVPFLFVACVLGYFTSFSPFLWIANHF